MIATLIPAPEPLGLPIPPALMFFLKGLGYFLHMLFMNLWLVGIPLALVLLKKRPLVSERFFKIMPFVMALGINAGIVPLLFLQTMYPAFFYSATILQAWFWLMVIPLVLVSYYAIYLTSFGCRRVLCSLVACVFLSLAGVIFASSMGLMEMPSAWAGAFQKTTTGGAVNGLYLYVTAPVFLRWGMVIGMALGTVAAFLALDSQVLRNDAAYRQQTTGLVAPLYLLGLVFYGHCGLLYRPAIAGLLSPALFWLTALSMPAAALVALFWIKGAGKPVAALLAVLHVGVILTNLVSRQIVQSARLEADLKLSQLPIQGEWGSVVVFVVTLLLGVATLAWIVKTIWNAKPQPTA